VGAALGTIMPTIMMAHMENIQAKSPTDQGPTCTADMSMGIPPMSDAIFTRYAHASSVVAVSPEPIAIRSRRDSPVE
jgi:hypothetical protein